MTRDRWLQAYDFSGRSVIVTGGTGVIGSAIVRALSRCGADVAILARHPELARGLMGELSRDEGKKVVVYGDVLVPESLRHAAEAIVGAFGKIDGLVNAAGGNQREATTDDRTPFFDLPAEALRGVLDLNLLGTVLPCQVFGRKMAERGEGAIVNISSMNAFRPLTRIPAYSAAKAGVSNFTQWLAVHMAREYSSGIRVNALAPGFFLTGQNAFLLVDQGTGELTERGREIVAHTPMGRFGDPDDLLAAALWLLSPAAAFVTGVVLPIDGGFSAYSGV